MVAAFAAYEEVRRHGKHIVPRPGDRLPLEEIEVDVVSGDGATLTTPLEGAGEPNAACAAYEPRGESRSENRRSLGVRVRFGAFRFIDLGDLVWNRLGDLVCPNNMLGVADAYLATHHANGDANVPAVLAALRPRVTIANNGPYKGGNRTVLASLRELPDTEDVWQLHRSASQEGDTAYDAYIANLEAAEGGAELPGQGPGGHDGVAGVDGGARDPAGHADEAAGGRLGAGQAPVVHRHRLLRLGDDHHLVRPADPCPTRPDALAVGDPGQHGQRPPLRDRGADRLP